MSLVDPFLIKSGILADIAKPVEVGPSFFSGVKKGVVFQNVILPLCFFLIIAFFLKMRYDRKKKRAQDLIVQALENDAIESYMSSENY